MLLQTLLTSFELLVHLKIKERLTEIQGLIHGIDNERRRNETNLNNLNRLQDKYGSDEKYSAQHKLRNQYKTCMNDAIQEESLIRDALAKIQEIRNIRNERRIQARNAGNKETIRRGALMKMLQISAQTLPLYVSKPDEKTPPLVGAIPADSSYIAKPGDIVAALVKGLEDEDSWILAEIVSFNSSQNKYEVDDIDETKDRHVLSKRRIVPLPLMRANPETDSHALFPKGTMGKAKFSHISIKLLNFMHGIVIYHSGLFFSNGSLPSNDMLLQSHHK